MARRQLTIIGSGPAGLTAAIYGRRSGLDVLVLEKGLAGGQINITAEIENYPGFKRVAGMELGNILREHAEKFGPEFKSCVVQSLSLEGDDKIIKTNEGDIESDAVIIASGASFVKSGCKGEDEFAGRGVSYCAVCDGAFFTDVPVAVIGGGNSAVEEADYLTQFASKVYVIHRRKEFRAHKASVERMLANPRIEAVMGCVVDEIVGTDMVEGIRARDNETGDTREIDVEGVFVFVGTSPNLDFLGGDTEIKQAPGGWIITDDKMETSAEGVFAAGDVRDKFLRQVVTAVGDGATAAMAAYEYLSNQYYLKSVLLAPEQATALFISSIVREHLSLCKEIGKLAESLGEKLTIVDAHTNLRLKDKLGVNDVPSLVELSKGIVARSRAIKSIGDAMDFLK